MRILSISTPNLIKNSPSQRANQVNYSTGKDTFTSFKANPKPALSAIQKGAQEVLNNPDLMRTKFPAFLAAAFAAMAGLAKGILPSEKGAQEVLNNPDLMQTKFPAFLAAAFAAMAGLAKGILPSEKDAIKAAEDFAIMVENEQQSDTEEIQEEVLEIEGLRSAEIKDNTINKQPAKGIELPRRHGTLSAQEAHLRETVLNIDNLSKESEQKLREIWNIIMTKGLTDEERKNADKKALAELKEKYNKIAANIAEELTQSENISQKAEDIINKYHEQICQQAKQPVEETPSYKSEVPDLPGFKHVGQISLEDLERMDGGKKRNRINPSENTSSTNTNNGMEIVNMKDQMWRYTAKGTLSDSFEENLSVLWREFKKMCITQTAEKENKKPAEIHIGWSRGYNIGKDTTLAHVMNELDKDKYTRINKQNAGIIAGLINGNSTLRECFTLHAAMRFIDRFIDFKSEVSLREQVQKSLDNLIIIIEKALKNRQLISKYEDTNGYIGVDLVIEMKNADIEAQRLLGSSDIIIGIGERFRVINNDNKDNNNIDNDKAKYAVIKTMY